MNRERYTLRFTMKAEGKDAEVLVYSEISSSKFWGDETTPTDFDKALKDAKKAGAENLTIRINSPGGEVYSAVAMRSMIIGAGFASVTVMIEGLCASAATLFATIPGANVVIAEGSEFMIHNPHTFVWGGAAELEKEAEHLRKMEEQFRAWYCEKTGHTDETIKDWMDEETWFTAKEAVQNGFADEVLDAEPVAACVTMRDLETMRGLYRAVPGCIAARDEEGSNGAPDAGEPTVNTNDGDGEEKTVEIKDITLEDLRAENPALLAQIEQGAAAAERERQSDIDALTMPGYEDMAEKAKADGTSAADYQKQVIAAMKAKGAAYLKQRQEETEPAKDVAGGVPQSGADEEKEIRDNAEAVARYAKQYRGAADGGMY